MTLEEKIKNLPENSGVYIMHDKAGNIIYVGTAIQQTRIRCSSSSPQRISSLMRRMPSS